ncbi:MAG TPA: hypothetical protein VHY91_12630 [Pirellulales bacterium]|nr:hypothetical protein [Pirellulales bacterium]
MKSKHRLSCWPKIALVLAAIAIIAPTLWAAAVKRSHPPKWDAEGADIFFPDARQALVGPRPTASALAGSSGSSDAGAGGSAGAGSNFAWSQLISSDTLEAEVKSIVRQLGETLRNQSGFTGGSYQDARRQFSVLAVMFAIISGYDSDVRWKQAAGPIRSVVSRAGFNCKVGTEASYREGKQRQDDLEKLVRGEPPQGSRESENVTWEKVSGRPPLMQRLEKAQREGLVLWTADAAQFQKHNAQFLHEAEMIAALAEVIGREGFEFADDETYLEYAHSMRDAAIEAAEAARKKNYEQASKAVGSIEKNCKSCHEGFRS